VPALRATGSAVPGQSFPSGGRGCSRSRPRSWAALTLKAATPKRSVAVWFGPRPCENPNRRPIRHGDGSLKHHSGLRRDHWGQHRRWIFWVPGQIGRGCREDGDSSPPLSAEGGRRARDRAMIRGRAPRIPITRFRWYARTVAPRSRHTIRTTALRGAKGLSRSTVDASLADSRQFMHWPRKAVVAKLLPPHNLRVREVSQAGGISEPTAYKWRKEAREQGRCLPNAGGGGTVGLVVQGQVRCGAGDGSDEWRRAGRGLPSPWSVSGARWLPGARAADRRRACRSRSAARKRCMAPHKRRGIVYLFFMTPAQPTAVPRLRVRCCSGRHPVRGAPGGA
jgi:hypothetical protein